MSLGRDRIISLGSKLPPAIGIFGRLRTLLDDIDCDVDAIGELVQMDPALTFQVIKLSNSAMYGLGARCHTLDDAIGRVGFNEIHHLVGLIVSRQAFQSDLAMYGVPAGRLWENSVAVGALASAFAARTGQNAGSAYSAGLLRNLGKVILNNHTGAMMFPGDEIAPDLHAWEKSNYGVNSAEATAMLLDHWRFPLEIAGAICTHRDPETGGEFSAGAATLHLAGAYACEWGCVLPGERAMWRKDETILGLLGIDADLIEGAVADARQQFGRYATIEWSRSA
jgi:HD-like signal output (HDOD) protein